MKITARFLALLLSIILIGQSLTISIYADEGGIAAELDISSNDESVYCDDESSEDALSYDDSDILEFSQDSEVENNEEIYEEIESVSEEIIEDKTDNVYQEETTFEETESGSDDIVSGTEFEEIIESEQESISGSTDDSVSSENTGSSDNSSSSGGSGGGVSIVSEAIGSLLGNARASAENYTVTIALNGGTLKSDDWAANTDGTYSIALYKGDDAELPHSVTLPTSTELSQKGAALKGWCTDNSRNEVDYASGDEITFDSLTGSITLWAVWELETYSVMFKPSADDDTIWQIDMEYGTRLWYNRTVSPWEKDDVVWQYYDANGEQTNENSENVSYGLAEVTIHSQDITVTKHFDIQSEKTFIYYTFTYDNTKWFTDAEGIIPTKDGYTFRDWYMIYPALGGTAIEGDTIFIARYMDTGGYIASVNFRYSAKTIAADSISLVIDYDSETNSEGYIYADFTADVLDGYIPIIQSSSDSGVDLGIYNDNDEIESYTGIDSDGITDVSKIDGKEYVYYIRINVNKASFTGVDGETIKETSDATVHYITFNVVYEPVPTGYRVNYFRELSYADLGDMASSGHSGIYELFECDEVIYDETTEKWNHIWYSLYTEETWAKVLEALGYSAADYPLNISLASTPVTTTNNEGAAVQYYYYDNNSPIADTLGLTAYYHDIQNDVVESHRSDTVYPTDIEGGYDGYVLGTGSLNLMMSGYELETNFSDNIRGIFYNRLDNHIYYITNSDSATVENELYVYGDLVDYPPAENSVRQGYELDTSKGDNGWIYYTDIPSLYDDPTEVLYNGTGLKPDTMPAYDIYAEAQWKKARVSITMNLYREAANYVDHVNEYQIHIGPSSEDVLGTDDNYIKFNSNGVVTTSTTYAFSAEDIFFSTGDVITIADVSKGVEDFYNGNIDGYSDYSDKTSDECKSYMLGYLTAYKFNQYDDMRHFTYSASYTTSSAVNDAQIEVSYDNGTDVRVLYERNWYVLEMFLGRRYSVTTTTRPGRPGTTTYYYQVATATNNCTFADCTWSNLYAAQSTINDAAYLPQIAYNSKYITTSSGTNSSGDSFTYYKLNQANYPDLWSSQTFYSDGSSRYLGPYGLFTDDYEITSGGTEYTCSVYYIYAKYGADISMLWPTLDNSIYITYASGNNYNYVSMGTNKYSEYNLYELEYTSGSFTNPNILNVFSTMSDAILNDDDENTIVLGQATTYGRETTYTTTSNGSTGFDPEVNSDLRADGGTNVVYHSGVVNHRMITYWSNPSTNYYYYLMETVDGTLTNAAYDISGLTLGGTGAGSNTTLLDNAKEGDIVKYGDKYYVVTGVLTQLTTNSVAQQPQPAMHGYESIGKVYNNSSRLLFFFYDRERYNLTLSNRGGTNSEYLIPTSVLNKEITITAADGSATTTTLAKQGFEIRDGTTQTVSYTVDGTTYSYDVCSLSLKYEADSEYLKYLTDYLTGLSSADGDLYDNYAALAYTLNTKGEGIWEFDNWYRDAAHTTLAWEDATTDATYTNSAYCDFTLYAGWLPPEYEFRFHLGRGSYQLYDGITDADSELYKMIWLYAVVPNTNAAYLTDYGYMDYVSEGDYMARPIEPILYGYEFVGWYYFNKSTEPENKVYLADVNDAGMELSIYQAGYTYTDTYGVVRYLLEDENGLYYDSNIRGLRYIFGSASPVYADTDVYAAYQNADSEKYNVWHIVNAEKADENGIDAAASGWSEVVINGTRYYLMTTDNYTNQKDNETYTINSKTDITANGKDGSCYLIPKAASRSLTIDRSLYPVASVDSNEYTYDTSGTYSGDGYVFITAESAAGSGTTYTVDGKEYVLTITDTDYTFYVIHEYDVTNELSYTVWYVDIDEAAAAYPDKLESDGYFSRYTSLDYDSSSPVFVEEPKEITFDDLASLDNLMVTEAAKTISGYTLLKNWQEEMTLLADASNNNIYFYYKRSDYNSYYNLTYYFMNSSNEYDGSRTVEIQYMPGIHASTVEAKSLADYWQTYINNALTFTSSTAVSLPILTVNYDGTKTVYNVESDGVYKIEGNVKTAVLISEVNALLADIFDGTIYDSGTNASSYIVVDSNSTDKFIDVYMRYGSIKIVKFDEAGNTLNGAKFNLVQCDENGDPTGEVYDVITETDGSYTVCNLPLDENYTYILSETSPPNEGYQLLAESVTLKVPFVSESPLDGDYDYYDGTYYYWYDLTCNVTDASSFDMPEAGGETLRKTIIIGLGLIFLSLLLFNKFVRMSDKRKKITDIFPK